MTAGQFMTILVALAVGFLANALTIILYLTGRIDRAADSLKELWRAEMATFKLEVEKEVKELLAK